MLIGASCSTGFEVIVTETSEESPGCEVDRVYSTAPLYNTFIRHNNSIHINVIFAIYTIFNIDENNCELNIFNLGVVCPLYK